MADVTPVDTTETIGTDLKDSYVSQLNTQIEKQGKIVRSPDGSFKENNFSVKNVIPTGPINWNDAYDINREGTHTTGRREGFENFLDNGIEPFGTPVNEGLAEVPAVVCGYLNNNSVIQDSETFQRNYGDIFNLDSEGYVIVLDSEVRKTDGYEVVGPEARLKTRVTVDMTKAIIVGNDKMENKVIESLKKRRLSMLVIRMDKTSKSLN